MNIKNFLVVFILFLNICAQENQARVSLFNTLKDQKWIIGALFLIIGPSIYYIGKSIKKKSAIKKQKREEEKGKQAEREAVEKAERLRQDQEQSKKENLDTNYKFLKTLSQMLQTETQKLEQTENNYVAADGIGFLQTLNLFYRKFICLAVASNVKDITPETASDENIKKIYAALFEPIENYLPQFINNEYKIIIEKINNDAAYNNAAKFGEIIANIPEETIYDTKVLMLIKNHKIGAMFKSTLEKNKKFYQYYFLPYIQQLVFSLTIGSIQSNFAEQLNEENDIKNELNTLSQSIQQSITHFQTNFLQLKNAETEQKFNEKNPALLFWHKGEYSGWSQPEIDCFENGNYLKGAFEKLNTIKEKLEIAECKICYDVKLKKNILSFYSHPGDFLCCDCHAHILGTNNPICPICRGNMNVGDKKIDGVVLPSISCK